MEPSGRSFKSRIRLTQVGDPLAHSHEGFANGISSDRLSRLAGLPVSEGEDDEVAELVFVRDDITEGRIATFGLAELGPLPEDTGLFISVLRGSSTGGEVERSAEIRVEEEAGLRCRRRQGVGCG